jgi:hypothetical protein
VNLSARLATVPDVLNSVHDLSNLLYARDKDKDVALLVLALVLKHLVNPTTDIKAIIFGRGGGMDDFAPVPDGRESDHGTGGGAEPLS